MKLIIVLILCQNCLLVIFTNSNKCSFMKTLLKIKTLFLKKVRLFHYKQYQNYLVGANTYLDYDTISNYRVK